MRYYEFIKEDLSRRSLLKGLAAAPVVGAGSTSAAPFRHGSYKDQLTGKTQGRFSKVRSDNSNATLEIPWGEDNEYFDYLIIDIPGAVLSFRESGRIKIGDQVYNIGLKRHTPGAYDSAALLVDIKENIIQKILNTPGSLIVEIPIYREGKKLFKFTIEPDSIAKSFQRNKKSEPSKMVGAGTDPSSAYTQRLTTILSSKLPNKPENAGSVEIEIRASSNGNIIGRRIITSSGNTEFDEQVLKIIDTTGTLPRDIDGKVPSSFTLKFGEKLEETSENAIQKIKDLTRDR